MIKTILEHGLQKLPESKEEVKNLLLLISKELEKDTGREVLSKTLKVSTPTLDKGQLLHLQTLLDKYGMKATVNEDTTDLSILYCIFNKITIGEVFPEPIYYQFSVDKNKLKITVDDELILKGNVLKQISRNMELANTNKKLKKLTGKFYAQKHKEDKYPLFCYNITDKDIETIGSSNPVNEVTERNEETQELKEECEMFGDYLCVNDGKLINSEVDEFSGIAKSVYYTLSTLLVIGIVSSLAAICTLFYYLYNFIVQ